MWGRLMNDLCNGIIFSPNVLPLVVISSNSTPGLLYVITMETGRWRLLSLVPIQLAREFLPLMTYFYLCSTGTISNDCAW